MEHFAGIDVRLEQRSVCTVDGAARCASRRWRTPPGAVLTSGTVMGARPLRDLAEGAPRGIVVDGGRIVETIPQAQSRSSPGCASSMPVRHVVLPGLINTHTPPSFAIRR